MFFGFVRGIAPAILQSSHAVTVRMRMKKTGRYVDA
jgi:hypothetical protein